MKPTKARTAKRATQKRNSKKPSVVPEDVIAPVPQPDQEDVVTQPEPSPELQNPIYKSSIKLLLIVLVLGWVFDFLFWKQGVGVNFSIFLTLCLLGGGYWLVSNKIYPAKNSLWLLLSFFFFAIFTFLRQEPLTIFLAFTFTLLSAGLFASSYKGGRWFQYGLSNYLYKAFLLAGDMIFAPISYFSKAQQAQEKTGDEKSSFPIWALLRGLVIALPIVACFGSLLAAGDVVFKEKLDEFLNLDDLSENIFRVILILFYAYLLAGTFVHSALRSKDEKMTTDDKLFIKPFIGFTESSVILGSVSVLFLAFVIVQFQYFFGGETNIGVEGYTYSQYARRGFNELVTVAFFSLVLVLGLGSLAKRENEIQRRVYSFLSIIMVALVIVILVSAYQRISLAIDWHGFSRLRLYPRIFLVWLGILLMTVAVLEFIRQEKFFAFAAVIASVGFAVSLTLFNVDAAIIRHNVPRTLQGKNLNVAHLSSLSMDAVPALADEFYSDLYPEWVHEGVGAALVCYLHYDSYDDTLDDWRSFNLSRWRARNILNDVESDIQEYGIDTKKPWDVKVRTPSNDWYDCKDYSGYDEE